MASLPSWIVDLAKILLADGVWRAQTRHDTKFRQNRSFPCGDIAIFQIFKMAAAAILIFEILKFYWLMGFSGLRHISAPNFVKIGQTVRKILRFFDFSRWQPSAILDSFGAYLDHPQWVLGSLYHSAKFGYDRCSSFHNMNISIFDAFGRKMTIHAPKIGVLGQFDALNGLQYQPKPKRHTLAWVHVIWAFKGENMVSSLTCRSVA